MAYLDDDFKPIFDKKFINPKTLQTYMVYYPWRAKTTEDIPVPSPSVTPSITPSITPTITPSITPTITPSATPLPPILDTYSANVAYSLNRKLKSTATNAMRIRRSNDNAEINIGFVGTAIDTAAITSFVGSNNAFITTIYDQSGNNRDASIVTLTKQPIVVSGGTILTENGAIYTQFDGNDDELRVNNIGTSVSSSMFTYLVSRGPGIVVALDEPILRIGVIDIADWGYYSKDSQVAIVRTPTFPFQQTLTHSTIPNNTFTVNFARQIGNTISLDINNTPTENLTFSGGTTRRANTGQTELSFQNVKFIELILNQTGSGNPQIYLNQLNFYNP